LITLSWLLLIGIVGGILALIDGILRVRSRAGSMILGIIEIVIAALFVLSLFLPGIPFGAIVLAVATIVVLIIGLILRGKRGLGLTLAALVVLVIWLVLENHWVVLPGVN